uniref:Large ribosomal subunit protein uL10m n=1 Tax=Steinernema glaseri TaxID=37863 RepID=A0A1I7YRH4_9BILA
MQAIRASSTSLLSSVGRAGLVNPVRSVSSKYTRDHPRPYKRRLFEAAVEPVLPVASKTCPSMLELALTNKQRKDEYADIELALAEKVKTWIRDEKYTVTAVCQFLPVAGRTLWLTRNQLRLKGLEFRNYGNRIMRKVFEGTPLSTLDATLIGSNCFLFAKDVSGIKTIVDETNRLNWIIPLAVTVGHRIISIEEANKLAKLQSLEDVRAETAQILDRIPHQLVQSLDSQSHTLVGSLQQYSQKSVE